MFSIISSGPAIKFTYTKEGNKKFNITFTVKTDGEGIGQGILNLKFYYAKRKLHEVNIHVRSLF